jgi:hypothetical protein
MDNLTFKTIEVTDYEITNDREILVNSNLNQGILNNLAKGGDAASLIKKEMIKLLKKKTGSVGNLSALIGNHIHDRTFESDTKVNFLGSDFLNVKFKTWWKLGGQHICHTLSAGHIVVGIADNGKMFFGMHIQAEDPIRDKHLPNTIYIKQN